MRAAKNVIVLTTGLSGSSVVTALLARAGFWTGDATVLKETMYERYETHENHELVALNKRLFEELQFSGRYEQEFRAEWATLFDHAHERVDTIPYRSFVEKCRQHEPWIWKDPRLWLTIRFWRHYLDLRQIRFVIVTRDRSQLWTSYILKRQIVSRAFIKRYEDGIMKCIREFLAMESAPFHELSFDALIEQPMETIQSLNAWLGTSLGAPDLEAIYHGPLSRPSRGLADRFKAWLIYAKNFRQRVR